MTDEKYTFIEDVRNKKKTATGAYHKRTHCGKGGAVRFPSDFMSKKERNAMNGEVKSYKLNDPMSWAEFKVMPDDIKVAYITALRNKFNVSDTKIAEMLGIGRVTLLNENKRLGISNGKHCKRGHFDEKVWCAWVNGVPLEAKEVPVIEEKMEKCGEEVLEPVEKCEQAVERIIPCRGSMTLKGDAEAVLETVKRVIAGGNMTITVYWCTEEAAGVVCDG